MSEEETLLLEKQLELLKLANNIAQLEAMKHELPSNQLPSIEKTLKILTDVYAETV